MFRSGFLAGIGWAFGVTVGFVLVSTILVFLLRGIGGLPIVGQFLANIVGETQIQLEKRSPLTTLDD